MVTQVAFMTTGPKYDVWVYNLARGNATRLISEGSSQFPIWTPDGKRLDVPGDTRRHAKCLLENGGRQWNRRALDDRGREPGARFVVAGRRRLLFRRSRRGQDIFALSSRSQDATFLQTPFNETIGRFSPDGRWVAYSPTSLGRQEIYLQPYRAPAEKC